LCATFSHDIENGNTKLRHPQLDCELPDSHQERVVWNFLSTALIIDVPSVDEALKATESFGTNIRKLDYELDLVLLAWLGEFLAVEWRLGTHEILLDSEGDFFSAHEEDDEYGVWFTAGINNGEKCWDCGTYCQETFIETSPASAVRSTPW
jgi:hypothetical protein